MPDDRSRGQKKHHPQPRGKRRGRRGTGLAPAALERPRWAGGTGDSPAPEPRAAGRKGWCMAQRTRRAEESQRPAPAGTLDLAHVMVWAFEMVKSLPAFPARPPVRPVTPLREFSWAETWHARSPTQLGSNFNRSFFDIISINSSWLFLNNTQSRKKLHSHVKRIFAIRELEHFLVGVLVKTKCCM